MLFVNKDIHHIFDVYIYILYEYIYIYIHIIFIYIYIYIYNIWIKTNIIKKKVKTYIKKESNIIHSIKIKVISKKNCLKF